MKMLISVLMLAAMSSVASARMSNEHQDAPQMGKTFACKGPFMRPGGQSPVGAPTLSIVEQLVPMGPMLPAFEHVYYLNIMPMNPAVAARTFKLQFVNESASGVHVYKVVGASQSSNFVVEHNFMKVPVTFKVYTGNSGMHYLCR